MQSVVQKKTNNFILCLVLATLKTDSSLCTPSTMKTVLLPPSPKYNTLEAGSCVPSSIYPLEIQYEILYFLSENMISLRGRGSIWNTDFLTLFAIIIKNKDLNRDSYPF